MAAPVVTLVHAGKNRLRYLIVGDGTGGTVVFTTTGLGAAGTDFRTDAVGSGPIKKIAKAATQAYGQIGPGALTQAQARGLWLNDRSGANSNPGASLVCAQPSLTRNSGTGTLDPSVDADVSAGAPIVNVVIPAQAGGWYLDVACEGTIGD